MSFRRKILYYGIMLVLTLLFIEGMARLAYYAAYGQGYGGQRPDTPLPALPQKARYSYDLPHPFYGFAHASPEHALNASRPRQQREDTVLVGLLGGSVAEDVEPYLQVALSRYFTANRLPRRPVVLGLASGALKQPQQTMIVANTLLQGGEFDLIVNLDGFNVLNGSLQGNFEQGAFPLFPDWWPKRVGRTGAEVLLAGRIGRFRREQGRLAVARETSILRGSALFGLANRYQRERAERQIIQWHQQLAATEAAYSLEQHGPRSRLTAADAVFAAAARIWYRGSVALARLAQLAGAEYYHFLQPNQHIPDSKPLSPEEQELILPPPPSRFKFIVERGYPLLTGFNRDLQNQGIHYFDLTGIFLDHPETLYRDNCCHLNARGNELLAAAMVERMEPALRRLGEESPARPVSALAAAQRPPEPPPSPAFQVSFQDDGKQLRYIRAGCAPEDIATEFFLHLTPRDLMDLPPNRRERGFDNRGFRFAAVGGRFAPWQCAAQIPLPDYPIAAIRTGQYVPGLGDLWSTELTLPADLDRLRADYAALSATTPAARDYFDLYRREGRLFYLRETCAAADTAAGFFLHIVPEDVADLPADRREAGFAHAGFAFVRQGGHFDGKCLAAVTLPDYPGGIKEMRTGQFVPGQGDLWSVALMAAP